MLSAVHRRLAYTVLAILFASGALHFILHQFFVGEGEFGPQPLRIEHPLLALHGAAAMAALMLMGSVLAPHALRFWRLGRNRGAGVAFLLLMAGLVLSGYGLYYMAGESLRPGVRWLHVVAGFVAVPVFLLHLLRGIGRRERG